MKDTMNDSSSAFVEPAKTSSGTSAEVAVVNRRALFRRNFAKRQIDSGLARSEVRGAPAGRGSPLIAVRFKALLEGVPLGCFEAMESCGNLYFAVFADRVPRVQLVVRLDEFPFVTAAHGVV